MSQFHGQPCYYCNEPIDDLAANPGLWGIPLCHRDDPGKVKAHHTGCVSKRLIENGGHERANELQTEKVALENFIKNNGLWKRWETYRDSYIKALRPPKG